MMAMAFADPALLAVVVGVIIGALVVAVGWILCRPRSVRALRRFDLFEYGRDRVIRVMARQHPTAPLTRRQAYRCTVLYGLIFALLLAWEWSAERGAFALLLNSALTIILPGAFVIKGRFFCLQEPQESPDGVIRFPQNPKPQGKDPLS